MQDQDSGYTHGAIRLLESGGLFMLKMGFGAYDIQLNVRGYLQVSWLMMSGESNINSPGSMRRGRAHCQ